MFDDKYLTEGDNPIIGLILCAKKNETIARYSVLNDSKQLLGRRIRQDILKKKQAAYGQEIVAAALILFIGGWLSVDGVSKNTSRGWPAGPSAVPFTEREMSGPTPWMPYRYTRSWKRGEACI
jgi:hypothetical protein